jgi:hypothetical protein
LEDEKNKSANNNTSTMSSNLNKAAILRTSYCGYPLMCLLCPNSTTVYPSTTRIDTHYINFHNDPKVWPCYVCKMVNLFIWFLQFDIKYSYLYLSQLQVFPIKKRLFFHRKTVHNNLPVPDGDRDQPSKQKLDDIENINLSPL